MKVYATVDEEDYEWDVEGETSLNDLFEWLDENVKEWTSVMLTVTREK